MRLLLLTLFTLVSSSFLLSAQLPNVLRVVVSNVPTVQADTTPPTGTISTPATDPFSTATTPETVSGTASDNVGVVSVTFSNSAGTSGTCTGTTSWSCSVALSNGAQTITVTACDAAKNCPGIDTVLISYSAGGLVCQTCFFTTSFRTTDGTPGWSGELTQTSSSTFSGKQLGINGYGGWTASPGAVGDKVSTTCNNSGGLGGRGFCHAVGDTSTGTGVNLGGQIKVVITDLIAAPSELWMQYSMSYPVGYQHQVQGGGGQPAAPFSIKNIYMNVSSAKWFIPGWTNSGGGLYRLTTYNNSYDSNISGGKTWAAMYGGTGVSDGSWACLESHWKSDTNGSNGTYEAWHNGTLIMQYTNVNYGADTFRFFAVTDNERYASNGGVVYTMFDDLYLSIQGRVNLC